MEGFLGEVRIFAGNFAPRSWAFCEGQLLAISSNAALFSILGTIYGGDGRTTFALPDLRGRVPIGPGNGPGLSSRREGQKSGSEHNILNVTQIPSHNHTATFNVATTASSPNPAGAYPATLNVRGGTLTIQASSYGDPDSSSISMNPGAVTAGNTGGNQPMNNMQPYISIYYIIALQGTFPSRN